ncbi:MAG: prolyl oligopeptidase family serine peptidase [Acidobacteriota bacterium]|nr:prolyl oligopeptidase family serine peptidase [Acidobacteriota bacterium]MDE3265175.1 prolyl oligopeptidase family serine peptidase [Acidobacteriota bacterium]
MRVRPLAAVLATSLLLPVLPLRAQDDVTLERIMAHPDWVGRQPEGPYWSSDGDSVYFQRKREGEETRDLYRIDLKERETVRVSDRDRAGADAAGGNWDRERRRRVFVKAGDVFVRDLDRDGGLTQITRTAATETAPFFTAGGDVAFRRAGVWFVRERGTGLLRQPFDVRTEDDPEQARAEHDLKARYLERQQPRLLEIVRERRQREERSLEVSRERQAGDSSRPALPHYLGKEVEVAGSALSPALDRLVLRIRPKERDEGLRDRMPNYVTATGMVEVEEVRMKVGTAETAGETLLLLSTGDTEPMTLDLSVLPGIADDPLADLREAARERRKARQAAMKQDGDSQDADDAEAESVEQRDQEASEDEELNEKEPGPRPVRFGPVSFNRDGSRAVVQIYSADNKDRWIAGIDVEAGELRPLHRMSDPAWINYAFRDMGWLPNDRTVFFLSEETGYSHLHLMDATTGERLQVTEGDFVVRAPQVSADGAFLFFEANRNHSGVFDIYRAPVSEAGTGAIEQVTSLGGLNSFRLSPDGGRLLIVHSTATRPPELWLQDASPGAEAVRLTETVSTDFVAIDWVAPRFVEVPSLHAGRPIHARLYLPPGPTTEAPRPAVVFVHGAGYLQNAHQGWSSYYREFMFHTLLARRGYVVLDMDFRASAGYGRDWRTAIYRQMGTPEVEDLADGIDYLVAEHGVDRERVGVYGGSYGGFVTFMAMFRRPELFAAGAALRPVTDWAHYNHGYTSNILNTPELDPEAYERSSPIEFAEGLRKPLLICTGMLDDNVLFQDSVRLVQRLIELGKEDWELAVYPAEAHGFVEPSSWLDEYRRILKLFETHLR